MVCDDINNIDKCIHDERSVVYYRKLYQRGIALVNRHAGLNLNPEGQEGITIVRYGVGGEYR